MTDRDPMQCCCRWGAAVKGEFPEFPCDRCSRHGDDEGHTCRRHSLSPSSAAVGSDPDPTASTNPPTLLVTGCPAERAAWAWEPCDGCAFCSQDGAS